MEMTSGGCYGNPVVDRVRTCRRSRCQVDHAGEGSWRNHRHDPTGNWGSPPRLNARFDTWVRGDEWVRRPQPDNRHRRCRDLVDRISIHRNEGKSVMATSLQVLCVQKGVSLLSLSEKSGVDLQRLQATLRGRWTPNATQRVKIALALSTPSDDIAWQLGAPLKHFCGP